MIQAHVLAGERIHGDDTTVPVLAKIKTIIGRLWTYVRDDRPFGGPAPPAAVFYYSRDREGVHPQQHLAAYAAILQADAYGGFGKLYEANRQPGPITEAACWVHGRRKFYVLADLAHNARRKAQGKTTAAISPLALEAVRRIDALFDIEREINGNPRQSVWPPVGNEVRLWWPSWRSGCAGSAPSSRGITTWRRPWTTCSSAGTPLPGSSTTDGSA